MDQTTFAGVATSALNAAAAVGVTLLVGRPGNCAKHGPAPKQQQKLGWVWHGEVIQTSAMANACAKLSVMGTKKWNKSPPLCSLGCQRHPWRAATKDYRHRENVGGSQPRPALTIHFAACNVFLLIAQHMSNPHTTITNHVVTHRLKRLGSPGHWMCFIMFYTFLYQFRCYIVLLVWSFFTNRRSLLD